MMAESMEVPVTATSAKNFTSYWPGVVIYLLKSSVIVSLLFLNVFVSQLPQIAQSLVSVGAGL